MELKSSTTPTNLRIMCLNRTFYGIETAQHQKGQTGFLPSRLNRTFYGIETIVEDTYAHEAVVLIVPFMELKLVGGGASQSEDNSLNRTFYGIETLLVVW